MQRSLLRFVLTTATLALVTGCQDKPDTFADARPVMRLSPSEALSADLKASRLVDRDTTTTVEITAPTTLTVRFPHEVEVHRVKVHGATSLRITGTIEDVGTPTPDGWAMAIPPQPVRGREFSLSLTPLAAGARLGELELWGKGAPLAPRDPAVLAALSRDAVVPGFGNAWIIRRVSRPEATLQPVGMGEPCLRTRFPTFDPRQARRAFLAFEANVPRGIALQQGLNGQAATGGFWLGTTRGTRTLLAEIDPERLRGGDEVLLCVPPEATASVDVAGVRLLLSLDDGRQVFDRETERDLSAALDGDIGTAAAFPAGPRELRMERALDVEHAELHLGTNQARLRGWSFFDGQGWVDRGTLALESSLGSLPLQGRVGALRLDFEGTARVDVPATRVAELRLEGSGVGPRVGAARIVLTYPALIIRGGRQIGERFGARAFVSGWAESPAGPGVVEIDGARVDTAGAFGTVLARQADAQASWPVTLRARFPDGTTLERTIYLDEDHEADLLGEGAESAPADRRFAQENETGWGLVDPIVGGTLTLGSELSLEAPSGAVTSETHVSVTRKGPEVMPKLDPGMINVTAPAHSAYRFLPRGQKFAKPVRVTLPYAPDLLPEGMAPEEIQTYYFDEEEDRWKTLPRKEVQRAGRKVVSETTHFTFMINAVLVMPDHPGPVSFNPTSLKDLKAAEPSAGIDLIEPPQPNNEGSAKLSYPLRLPKARGQHQPSLAISYDSAGNNGWLGVGWDLALPSVSLDTRYGLPEFDGEERYLLSGQQLIPVDPNSPDSALVQCVDGSPGRTYAARVEGSFQRIIRCGATPPAFWFQVEDKAGTLLVFGRSANARLASYLPRVTNPPTYPPTYDIAQWHLERVVDINGNLTEYGYQHDSLDAAAAGQSEPFRMVYPRSIRFTGRAERTGTQAVEGGQSGPYLVEFLHENAPRKDAISSGRHGFKTVLRHRLGRVGISLLGGSLSGLIRSYVLQYEEGDLGKSRLASVQARGADGSLFHTHTFEYEDRAPLEDDVVLFSGPVAWTSEVPADTSMSGSSEWGFGFHGFVGIGAGPSRSAGAVGLGFGYSRRETNTLTSFIDLNGDGLPDRIYRDRDSSPLDPVGVDRDLILFNHGPNGGLSEVPPEGDPAGRADLPVSLSFGEHRLGKDVGNSFDVSLQLFSAVANANFGVAYTASNSSHLVIDANGDGLADLINDGKVLLNQPRSTECTVPSATCCPAGQFCFANRYTVPALVDLGDSSELVTNDPTLAEANDALANALTPEDAVLEWTAPYEGRVDVTGILAWAAPQLPEGRRDGVRLSAYHYDPLDKVTTPMVGSPWTKTPADTTGTAVHVPSLHVRRGDLLYFVVSTLSDAPLNGPSGELSPVELVRFAPVVTYLGVWDAHRPRLDPTGARAYRFDAAADFLLAGEPQGAVTLPRDGELKLTLEMTKRTTSDEVRTCVQYYPPGKTVPQPLPPCVQGAPADDAYENVYSTVWAPDREANGERLEIGPRRVASGGVLVVRQESHVAIDPRAVAWKVSGTMRCVDREGGTCLAPTGDELAAVSFTAQPYVQLHENVYANSTRWLPDGRAVLPYVTPTSGKLVIESSASYADREVPIWFTVRTLLPEGQVGGGLVLKAAGNHGVLLGTVVLPLRAERRLDSGTSVFLEGHSESAKSIGPRFYFPVGMRWPQWNVKCHFVRDDGRTDDCSGVAMLTTDQRKEGFEDGNAPLLAGGHRGWRYGAWNGKDGAPFEPWVYRSPPKGDEWKDDPAELKKRKNRMKDENDPERRRLELLGLLVPNPSGTRLQYGQDGLSPDKPAYVSTDGNTFFHAGLIHAGKKGQSASNVRRTPGGAVASPADFRIGKLGRSSLSVSVSAGVDIAGIGGGVSAGLSQQKLDLADMNGDGFIDVIAAGGLPDLTSLAAGGLAGALDGSLLRSDVRLTSPLSLTTARKLQLKGLPRVNYDFSGQIGLGVSEPIRALMSDTELREFAARLPSVSGGLGFNVSSTAQDLVDINGDGLPDLVRRNSPKCGGQFGVRLNLATSFAASEDCVGIVAAGGAAASTIADTAPGSIVGGALTLGGDPDDGDTTQNKGLAAGMLLGGPVSRTETVTLQGTAGSGFGRIIEGLGGAIDRTESYGASVTVESSLSAVNVLLMDVTGDRLPDYVWKGNAPDGAFHVMVNLGYGFAPPRTWRPAGSWYSEQLHLPRLQTKASAVVLKVLEGFVPDQAQGIAPLQASGTHSVLPSASVAVSFAFPIIPPAPVFWLHVGGGAHLSPKKLSGFELGLEDVDGDGLVDHVLKTGENRPVFARLNQLGRANLLRRVERPLGGSFELAYARVGNTVDMQESRWVLEKVVVHDGRAPSPGATGHDFTTTYAYFDGRFDRIEREFLGFARVERTNPDSTRLIQRFDTESVLTKGLLLSERMEDAEGRPWTETVNTWSRPIQVRTPRSECKDATPVFLNKDAYCGAYLTKLDQVEKRFFEGHAEPGMVTRQRFVYDAKGDVTDFQDDGDVADPADGVVATVTYAQDPAASTYHSVSRAESVEVRDLRGTLVRGRSATYDTRGNLHTFSELVAEGKPATSTLTWYDTGRLKAIEGPANATGQRYKLEYTYDEETGTYATSTLDSHGLRSSTEYDLRFGEATRTVDTNGHAILTQYDAFGRLERIAGPYDTLAAPTVHITYAHGAFPAYAWTRNRLPRAADDLRGSVDTVAVMDGLGRVIQTKKTAEMATGKDTRGIGWSVSGHEEYDIMGRVAARGQPFASFSARPDYVPGTPRNPTHYLYDVLGRPQQVDEPTGAVSRSTFDFATPSWSPYRTFRTTTTDAEGKVRAAYQDTNGQVIATEEWLKGRVLTTRYTFDAIGQLSKVTDTEGNVTTLAYDLLGRRTRFENPDTGRIDLEYDLAGNLIRKVDANLRAQGGTSAIRYAYDHLRLTDVQYPGGARNVHYEYGKTEADRQSNAIGRITTIMDDVGREERSYGRLGELTSTTRHLRPLQPGDRWRSFTTSFEYDSFGRMLRIGYPDGETVRYRYDAGGLLERAYGERPATAHTPAQVETYLASASYDALGRRVQMVLGNGVTTRYTYEPLSLRLHTVTTVTPLGRTLQAITYGYDHVGNIRSQVNALGEPVGDRSGAVSYEYRYDDLHRLTWVHGEARARPHTIDRFTSTFGYSDIHNITSNVQLHEVVHGGPLGGGVETPPKTNHALAYTYAGVGPHQPTRIGDRFVVYDANGNTLRECRDHGDPTCQSSADHLRRYVWTEENRLDQVIDGGGRHITRFFYDAAGDRVVKLGRGGESISIGQFWSLKGRRAATKHIFAGTTRLASKLLPPPGWDDVPHGNLVLTDTTVASATVNDNGCVPSNYQPNKCPVLPGGDPVIDHPSNGTHVRPETYYYHLNHLGSTSWVTDQHGRVHEHVEYFPYGGVWRDARSDADGPEVKGQRFLFTGKEFDEETGLYSFGARYLDPESARWLSVDPAVQDTEFLTSNSAALSVYLPMFGNPMRLVDPTGLQPVEFDPTAGHHFVPQHIAKELLAKGRISKEAFEVFMNSLTGWGKDIDPHGNSAAHGEYNQAVRSEFESFAKKFNGKLDANAARQFVQHVKTSSNAAIRGFLDPHLKVVQMIKQGQSAKAINAYWKPIKQGFTRGGGFSGFASRVSAVGRVGGRALMILNVLSIYDEFKHVWNGDEWVPADPTSPMIGHWAPANSAEAQAWRAYLKNGGQVGPGASSYGYVGPL